MHMIDRNSPCWCGSGLKYKKCHYDFDEKLKMYENKGCIVPEHNMIKTPEQIEKIKASARVNIAVLDYVAEHIKAVSPPRRLTSGFTMRPPNAAPSRLR